MATYNIDKQQIRRRILVSFVVLGVVLAGSVVFLFYRTLQAERDPVTATPAAADAEISEQSTDRPSGSVFQDADEERVDVRELNDAQRKEDIDRIHAELQRYFQEKDRYPTLANMNSTGFREAEFSSLEDKDFTDPENEDFSVTITRTPQPTVYSYEIVNEDGYTCEPVGRVCVSYTLSAILSNETAYQRKSDE